jgi:predicted dehydrogenase
VKRKPARNYDLAAAAARTFPAPRLPYEPPRPRRYRPRIGLVGCGGIAASHLDAYRAAGWTVAALCDVRPEAARARRDEFAPGAQLFADAGEMLARADVDVVDIALHPEARAPVIEAALRAGRHVLSQKPFVRDLATGERLVALAARRGLKLAVNQNGRWAPYASYLRQAIARGHVGEVQSVDIRLNWDHTWVRGTPFEKIRHLVLYDFAIHWFDLAAWFLDGRPARRVFAATARAPGQTVAPPLLATAQIVFDGALAQLAFDGSSRFGAEESIVVTGTDGTLRARGPVCAAHDVALFTRRGRAAPRLKGRWFHDGFRGAMGELLCAIEEGREPAHSARANLRSLAICFAAMRSADTGRPQIPGRVRRAPA